MMVCLRNFRYVFFEKLADPLIQALNQSFVDGECRFLKAVMTSIEKKGKDKTYI